MTGILRKMTGRHVVDRYLSMMHDGSLFDGEETGEGSESGRDVPQKPVLGLKRSFN